MLDLLIHGGKVVTPNGPGLWDVGVANGKIAVVAAPEVLQHMQAARTLDASGKLVIPGGIDPHIHCSWPVNPGLDGTPPEFSAGPEQVLHERGATAKLPNPESFAVWFFRAMNGRGEMLFGGAKTKVDPLHLYKLSAGVLTDLGDDPALLKAGVLDNAGRIIGFDGRSSVYWDASRGRLSVS